MKKFLKTFIGALLVITIALSLVACGPTSAEAKLKAIAVTEKPAKIEYVSGETFDPTGMVVTAAYDDGSTKTVTGYTYDKTAPLKEEDNSVKVSYTEGEITKTTSFAITVTPGIDHVKYHEFDASGKCSCGALMFEAEDADIKGTPTGNSDTFIVETTEASGGACIGNWADGDDRWTSYLTLEEDLKDVVLGIRFAPTSVSAGHTLPLTKTEADRGVKGSTLWAYEMRVNGEILSWQSGEIPSYDGQSYFNWKIFLSNPVSFTAGENKVEIESWDNFGMNIDYIFVQLPAGTTASFSKEPSEPPVPVHEHSFVDGKCECGAIKIEAEDCEVTGTPASWAGATNDTFYRENGDGMKVGAWGANGDNKIYIRFTSDQSYENVKMTFSVQTGGIVNGEAFAFYAYDETTSTKGSAITHPSLSGGISEWIEITSAEFSIAAGENTFVIEAYQSCEIDWDYFILEGLPDDAVITVTPYEISTPPVEEHTHVFDANGKCSCGAIKIEAEDCEVTGTPASWAGTTNDAFYRGNGDGMKVGAWGVNGDNKIYIRFTSDQAYENVKITFSVQTGGIVNGEAFLFYAYDETTSTKGSTITHPSLSGGISEWTEIVSAEFSIAAGENVFVIEAYQSCEIDWDYFILEGIPAGASITVTTRNT